MGIKKTKIPTFPEIWAQITYMHGDASLEVVENEFFMEGELTEENAPSVEAAMIALDKVRRLDPRGKNGLARKLSSQDEEDVVGYFFAGLVEEWPCDVTTNCDHSASIEYVEWFFRDSSGTVYKIEPK